MAAIPVPCMEARKRKTHIPTPYLPMRSHSSLIQSGHREERKGWLSLWYGRSIACLAIKRNEVLRTCCPKRINLENCIQIYI